ncbi:hypothetical protein [Rhodovulum sp. YEN HP10]|uniref:hypothetical protein n=1 Tax=Rhodovulum sp. HP10 TaxID=3387397 RepID=UPI0039E05D2C
MPVCYEYRVLPAPERGRRSRGLKGPAERFAYALEETMNEMAAEGWTYLRAESLPSEERQGLFGGRRRTLRNVLVFRRAREARPDRDRDQDADRAPAFSHGSPEAIAASAMASAHALPERTYPPLGAPSRAAVPPRPEQALGGARPRSDEG